MASSSRTTAGLWIIGLGLYMIIMTFVIYNTNGMNEYYNINSSANVTSISTNINFYAHCVSPENTPSYYADSQLPADTIVARTLTQYDKCKSLVFWQSGDLGIAIDDYCNSINGCTYLENASNTFTWLYSGFTSSYCNGTINYTSYGIDTTNWSMSNKTSGFCSNDGILNNETNCRTFGCVWLIPNSNQASITGQQDSVINFVWQLMTWQIDIGLTGQWLVFFNLIFVTLPLIALVMAGIIFVIG